jgi:hypothetical protein
MLPPIEPGEGAAPGSTGSTGSTGSSSRLASSFASRQRVDTALAHLEPDMVPLDLGGGPTTGMHVSAVYRLRQALGLDGPGTPVKVIAPYSFLGEVQLDLADALGVDVVAVGLATNSFGFVNEGWKPWTTFDGTPVLVPGLFCTDIGPDGSVFIYPEGDTSVPPSARMPKNGFYFEAIKRQGPIDDERLNVEDNLEEFVTISNEELDHIRREVDRLFPTGKAILGSFGAGTNFGDVSKIPGMNLKHPKGIRDVAEWYMSLSLRPGYVYDVFERQCEIGLRNLAAVHQAVGDKITAVLITTTDFGAQQGPFVSPKTYRDLFKPFYTRVNTWVHENTKWKTFIHSCGSIWRLLDDIVDSGFDLLNPVQTSAADMSPESLKQRFGDQVTFWGGGIDTQRTLPLGTPADVRAMVRERMRVFGRGGGFVFNAVHNVQADVPTENLVALFEAVREFRGYPLG